MLVVPQAEPGARLSEVMIRDITAVTADVHVDRLDKIFQIANVSKINACLLVE